MPYLPDETAYTILPARSPGHAPPVWVNLAEKPTIGEVLTTDKAVQLLARRMAKDQPPALVLSCAILLHFSNGNHALADQLAEDFFREWIAPNARRVSKISGKQLFKWICKKTMRAPTPGRELHGPAATLKNYMDAPLHAEVSDDELAELHRAGEATREILEDEQNGGAQ